MDDKRILFYGTMNQLLLLYNIKVKELTLYVQETEINTAIEQCIIIFNSEIIDSVSATQIQRFAFPTNVFYTKEQLMQSQLLKSKGKATNIKKAYLYIIYHKM